MKSPRTVRGPVYRECEEDTRLDFINKFGDHESVSAAPLVRCKKTAEKMGLPEYRRWSVGQVRWGTRLLF